MNSPVEAVIAVLLLLMASSFHAGVIGLLAGYTFLYMFYSPKSKAFTFRPRTVSAFLLMMLASMVVYLQFGHVFLAKFQTVEDIAGIYGVASSSRGGSAYLTSLKINSIWQLFVYAPIKMIYFLVVPLPHHWRGFNDVVAFMLDGVVYLYFLLFLIKQRRVITRTPLAIGLTIALLGAIFVFGVGISNAGTALRHRQKIYPIFLVLLALVKDQSTSSLDPLTHF